MVGEFSIILRIDTTEISVRRSRRSSVDLGVPGERSYMGTVSRTFSCKS